jgi:DNA-binding transcriptional MerR regulator
MTPHQSPDAENLPVYDAETDMTYTIDVVAELAGVDSQMVLHYQEQGFIRAVDATSQAPVEFDDESLRRIRQIEHLRRTCAVNDAGLKLILGLLHEIEDLRRERRQAQR